MKYVTVTQSTVAGEVSRSLPELAEGKLSSNRSNEIAGRPSWIIDFHELKKVLDPVELGD